MRLAALDVIIKELIASYPEHAIYPYFRPWEKLSVVKVPLERVSFKPSESKLVEIIRTESMLLSYGYISDEQTKIQELQRKLSLEVIALEDFFKERLCIDLAEIGYEAKAYYHTAFARGKVPKGVSKVKHELLYK